MLTSYEPYADDYICYRSDIGVADVRVWGESLDPHSAILDLGCGHGQPLAAMLAGQGHRLFGIDVSPTLLEHYRKEVAGSQVECNAILESGFFDRKFDAVLAWGLMFLMPEAEQLACFPRIADATRAGGAFLFSAPRQACQWQDLTSGQPSFSLGTDNYRAALRRSGFELKAEFSGEGGNYYYDSIRLV